MNSLVRMTPTFSPSPKTAKSRALWERARQVAPMGAQGEGKYYAPFPHFVARAKGAYLWDADDNRYIDYWNGAGPCILGHVDEHVESRVADVVRTRGDVFCAPNEVEVELCEPSPHHSLRRNVRLFECGLRRAPYGCPSRARRNGP